MLQQARDKLVSRTSKHRDLKLKSMTSKLSIDHSHHPQILTNVMACSQVYESNKRTDKIKQFKKGAVFETLTQSESI